MRSTIPGQEALPNVGNSDQQLTEAVNRVLGSPVFERTHRLSELLTYLCRCTIAGDSQALKEGAIGHAIFGRPLSYNAADDNIVRANVRQLRIKLDEYYQTIGAIDPYRVTVPKGSYALRVDLQPELVHETVSLPAPPVRPRRKLPLLLLGASLLAVLAGGIYLLRQISPPQPSPSLLTLLAPAAGQKLMVIGPDSGVQFYRDFTGHSVRLEQFINRGYLSPQNLEKVAPNLPDHVLPLFRGGYIQTFVVGLVPAFAQVIPPESLTVPPPVSVKVDDFERDNAILISGPLGNPWVQLFDGQLNFQIEEEQENQRLSMIVNRKPQPGEPAIFKNFTDHSNTVVCYARLAYLPGRSPRTRVLLAGGPHAASTQAASLFLTRPEFFTSLRQRIPSTASGAFPWFEAVVEARAIGTEPWTARVVAFRTVEGP